MDLIDHPSYYDRCSDKTRHILKAIGVKECHFDRKCIDVIEGYFFLVHIFHLAEAATHLWRYGRKPGEAYKDLCKAEWYLLRFCEYHPKCIDREKYGKAAAMVRELIDSEFPNGDRIKSAPEYPPATPKELRTGEQMYDV
jgi:hypothetical protein